MLKSDVHVEVLLGMKYLAFIFRDEVSMPFLVNFSIHIIRTSFISFHSLPTQKKMD